MDNYNHFLEEDDLKAAIANLPKSKPSLAFYRDGQMYITRFINGEPVTKKAMRDPNHSGFRYGWVEQFTDQELT